VEDGIMLSKNPLDLPVGRKFSKEEMLAALRLGIIAELDAINLYIQLAECIDDPSVKRVFEDIAKEEKTHVGEFLALLKKFDQEQAAELEAGAKEVEELSSKRKS
jgi:rubrerythrin